MPFPCRCGSCISLGVARDRRDRRIAELEAIVARQQAMIETLQAYVARLEATVAELQARLGENSANSSKPPSSDPPGVVPARAKRGKRSGKRACHIGQPSGLGERGHF